MDDPAKRTRADEMREAHRQFTELAAEETTRRNERARKLWRTVYIAVGLVILCGLVWVLLGRG